MHDNIQEILKILKILMLNYIVFIPLKFYPTINFHRKKAIFLIRHFSVKVNKGISNKGPILMSKV